MGTIIAIILVLGLVLFAWSLLTAASIADEQMGCD